MASFIGTNKEFRRYIGPRLRNLVQQITKSHKAEVAACEYCGASENLESAHVRGRDRNEIIDLVVSEYATNEIVTIDLGVFEEKFKAEHVPIEKSILILCRPCHRKYDAKGQTATQTQPVEKGAAQSSRPSANSNDLLPITLTPSNPAKFKEELLVSKKAEIQSYYSDGRIEITPWNISRFSASSDLMGNLRSRPEFRSGNWQSHGIVKVRVKVITNA
jgi:hypothetical protein